MRALARETGRHPSTVMRAVHRIETRRDDPLFDGLLGEGAAPETAPPPAALPPSEAAAPGFAAADLLPEEVARSARTALRRLSEPGAFLMVATGSARGGIFCAANQHRKPIAMLALKEAKEFVRRDWIRLSGRGTASLRYRITEAGRAALKRILAADASAPARMEGAEPAGFAEAPTPFLAQHRIAAERVLTDPETARAGPRAVNLGESPLGWLARRKGADGQAFLAPEEVEAGERLREDFERAQMGPRLGQDWSAFLTPCDRGPSGPGRSPAEGPQAAREAVSRALAALGPGLADAALRVCCFLEGLEACEKRMGWSARSGKVVLKLALQRLVAHYGLIAGLR